MEENYIKFQEQEKDQIARNLHDVTVQNMTHMVHKLELISKYIDKDSIQAKLECNLLRNFLKDTIKDTRNMIFDLRPMSFDDLGFCTALKNFIDEFMSRYQLKIEMELDKNIDYLSDVVLINIFRVIQEFCMNSVKHSRCSMICIKISFDQKHLHIALSDDGVGCVMKDTSIMNHYGLKIMKERIQYINGRLSYISYPGQGFMLDALIPIN